MAASFGINSTAIAFALFLLPFAHQSASLRVVALALPVPGMRQRMAAGKAEITRETVAAEAPAIQCLQLARPEQRRGATLIDGQTVAE
ncbi:hypothetical protein AWF64_19425 [Escherichia coli]|nr:hypothetical protein AWF64_19425 [Escherichia coli]